MSMTNTFHSSAKGNSIRSKGKLSAVQRHNERGYFSFDYDKSKIFSLIGDASQLVISVENYINTQFQSAVDEYNEKQKRADRKIKKTPFEYFSDNKNLDIANEIIFQIADKEFWSATRTEKEKVVNGKKHIIKDFPIEVKTIMNNIFLKQAKAYENIYKTHSEEILRRIMEDYKFSKEVISSFTKDEIELFSKGKGLKKLEKSKYIKTLTDEQKEKYERFLSAEAVIDFVEKKRIIERIKNGDMLIKLMNLTSHFDEWSPHGHGVSVCSVKGFENGLNERVAKSVVLNKWSLEVIQDVLHEIAEKEMAKYPELFTVKLEEKQKGRNYDFSVPSYKMMKYQEELDKLICELNSIKQSINDTEKEFEETKYLYQSMERQIEESVRKKHNEAKDLTRQIGELIKIKSQSEQIEAVSETENLVKEVIGIAEKVDGFVLNLKEDEEYGGMQAITITKDFMWDWQKLSERLFMVLNLLLERIRSLAIFEKMKESDVFDSDILSLQSRISNATTKSNLSDKDVSKINEKAQDDYDNDYKN